MDRHYSGLTSAQAVELLKVHGRNELQTKSAVSPLTLFINQFKNVLILLLCVAAVISIAIGDLLDSFFILLIVILNAILGFVQEYKAENALKSLRSMTVSKVRIIRGGIEQMIDSHLLVPGDIVKLEEGDKIQADGHVLESRHLEINEASLTGESMSVTKSEKDTNNLVFMGTIVTGGSAVIQLTATGQDSKFGQLASSLTTIKEQKTPLERKIAVLGRQLSFAAIGITLIIFILGILQERPLIEMVLTSISLAVAAVPEGLPAVITIALAVGLQRMARKKAILRKLGAIEALGNTTVIVTDKTGTLTENKMRVIRVWTNGSVQKLEDINSAHTPDTDELLKAGILNNKASLIHKPHEQIVDIIGEQTEGSLLLLAHDAHIDIEKIKEPTHVKEEYGFDQTRKIMSMAIVENDTVTIYTKGAPESVLARSTHVLKNGKSVTMTAQEKHAIQQSFDQFAAEGLRILALAEKRTTHVPTNRDEAEKGLTFVGFVGIADPPRKEIKEVLQTTLNAGIRTVMVTGDNPLTARAIGHHVGLIHDGEAVITGDELKSMSDEELKTRIDKITIFARTTPEDKFRIVKLLQEKGEIVTVTGDGVNDALALKQANTGVAMGITGTDVAKEVADMVITNDNFASIVSAISEGRIIFDNMVKSITYLIATNLGEVLLILSTIVASLFLPKPLPTPLLPVHILWINLVTDGLPALSLAFDRGTNHTMKPRPGSRDTILLRRKNIIFMVISGTAISLISFLVFITSVQKLPVETARILTFNTLVILQLGVVFFVREGLSVFSNKILLVSILISIALQTLIMFVPPFTTIFEVVKQ